MLHLRDGFPRPSLSAFQMVLTSIFRSQFLLRHQYLATSVYLTLNDVVVEELVDVCLERSSLVLPQYSYIEVRGYFWSGCIVHVHHGLERCPA